MSRIIIVTDPLAPSDWEIIETDRPADAIRERFRVWPATARVFDIDGIEDPSRLALEVEAFGWSNRDLTPRDRAGVERLARHTGPLMVTTAPGDPITAIIAIVAAVALSVVATFLLMPKISFKNRVESPNNSLSDRSNKARPLARIPEILGTVRATPDLIAVPYRLYVNHQEVEIALMCVGRGSYDIADVRDGSTPLVEIVGASATIYGPGTSPNYGTPQAAIGTPVADPVLSIVKLNEVNGQTLRPPNSNFVKGDGNIRFTAPDTIENNGTINWTTFFSSGDVITVSNSNRSSTTGAAAVNYSVRFYTANEVEFQSVNPSTLFTVGQVVTVTNAVYTNTSGGVSTTVDLSGTYQVASFPSSSKMALSAISGAPSSGDWGDIASFPSGVTVYKNSGFLTGSSTVSNNYDGTYTALSVTSTQIVLSNPSLVNSNWSSLSGSTGYGDANLSTSGDRWVGPFTIDLPDLDRVLANFQALQGLYQIDKKGKQASVSVSVLLELTPVDQSGTPTGAAQTFTATVQGSADTKTSRAQTLRAAPTFTGRCKVRARRTSATDLNFDGTLVDEVKWTDMYGMAAIDQNDFGDVTLVHAQTYATNGAVAVKERRLNLLATRKLPQRVSGSTFTTTLYPTESAADIIAAITVDSRIGRRTISELDVDSVYDSVAAILAYFGSANAGKFGFSFDDDGVTYEETVQTVAQAVFSTMYRSGSILRMKPEIATENSVMLFNHRNILPGSQRRNISFGTSDDNDGVAVTYQGLNDGAPLSIAIPVDNSAAKPLEVTLNGVRYDDQAYFHAWRAQNKLTHQTVALEQQTTEEGRLVTRNDRVLISDQTRPDMIEGQVDGQAGTTLTLSQPVDLSGPDGYTIFLQHTNGAVEALDVVEWAPGPGESADPYRVVVSATPALPLVTDPDAAVQTGFIITENTDFRSRSYLITEREPEGVFAETIRAINYTPLYYQNDALALWYPVDDGTLTDRSPYRADGVPVSTAPGFVTDTARGPVLDLTDDPFQPTGFTMPASYTKALWLKVAPGANAALLVSNSGQELLSLASGNLVAGHNGTAQLSAAWPTDSGWHHAALTYRTAGNLAALYIDGKQVAAGAISTRTPGGLTLFDNLVARVDDVRVWARALASSEVLALYRAARA